MRRVVLCLVLAGCAERADPDRYDEQIVTLQCELAAECSESDADDDVQACVEFNVGLNATGDSPQACLPRACTWHQEAGDCMLDALRALDCDAAEVDLEGCGAPWTDCDEAELSACAEEIHAG